jgi:hypothetical protein
VEQLQPARAERRIDVIGLGRDVLAGAVMAAAAVAVNGYRFGTTDQAIHLTFLRRLLEPASMSGDLVADHAGAHASLFWHMQVPLVRVVGWERLDLLYLALWLVCLTASFVLLLRIARTLLADRWAAMLAPLLLVAFKLCPAHVRTFEPEMVNRTFTHPLLLGALWLLLRGRLVKAAALCGLAWNLHASTATHLLLALVGAGLLDPALRRKLPAALGAFALGAAPLLVMLVIRGDTMTWWIDDEWMHVLRWRMPHHLFPGRWPAGVWIVAGLQLGLWLAAARWLRPEVRRRGHGLVLGVLVCGPLLGTLVAGPLPIAPLLGLHLWESWILLALLAYLAAAGLVVGLVRGEGWPRRLAGVLLGAVLLLGIEGWVIGLDRDRGFAPWAPDRDRGALVETLRDAGTGREPLLVAPVGLAWVRPFSGRGLYVSAKDGGEAVFDRELALAWRQRLAELCGEDVLAGPPPADEWLGYRSVGERATAAFDRQPDRALRALAIEHRAWQLVVPAGQVRQGLTPLYGNDRFTVYDVRLLRAEEP